LQYAHRRGVPPVAFYDRRRRRRRVLRRPEGPLGVLKDNSNANNKARREGDDEEEGKDNRGYLVDQRTSVTHLTNQKGFELRTCLAKLKGDADSCLQDTFVRYFVA
jgi:hypothetical protein